MKIKSILKITILFLLICFSNSLFAKWAMQNEKGQVLNSDLILIGELGELEESKKPFHGFYTQKINLKVKTILKGSPPKITIVYGSKKSFCASSAVPLNYKKGQKVLIFLRKSKDGFVVVNGSNGLCPITKNLTKWFTGNKSLSQTETPTKIVITKIKTILSSTDLKK
jgi:hypothetical protein